MLLSISVSNDSLSDGEESPKKSTPKWAYAVTIGIAVVLAVSGYILSLDFTENSVEIFEENIDCDFLLSEARLLIDKNDNELDVDQWELEEDTIKIREINQRYSDNCIPTKENVMSNLQKCTIIYITIESLIDKMEERQLDSLSQAEQRAYNTNYDDYFDSYCNKIKDEIEQTDKFQNFNITRGE